MYAIEGYSHKEIAEMLGISEGTSKSQYARAKMHLRNMLNAEKPVSSEEEKITTH
jgi:RNA polymerase sigma-70 factor (ECF subfamily)